MREFKKYIRHLIEVFPELIWCLNLELGFFQALVLAYINTSDIIIE